MKRGVLWLVLLSALIPHLGFAQTEQKLNIYGYMLFQFEQYLNPGGRYSIIPNPDDPADFVRDDKTGFNAFRITRTYLYFKYQPNDNLKTQVTIDSLQDADGLYRFSLRYAFMEYKFAPEFKIRMGLQYNPWNMSSAPSTSSAASSGTTSAERKLSTASG